MKNNWQAKKLDEVCKVFDDGDWIEKKDQSSKGIRLVQTGNIGNGIFKDRGEKARYISESKFKQLRCTEIFPADCLVSRLPDPVGRSCVIPDIKEKMITAVDCTIIRFQKEVILPQWFVYYSLSQEYQNQINKQISGATRQRISRNHLGLIEIPLPTVPEQQRIVAILDETFSAIAMAKENAEKNLQNARELFESYLQSIFANPDDGWGKKKLGEVCDFYNGQAHEQHIDEHGAYILINSKFVSSNGKIYKRTNDALSPLFNGDIAFVMSDVPNGKALAKCFLVDKNDSYTLNQRICVIRSINFENKFLYYQLNRNKYLLSFNNGENQTNLRKNDILNCPLLIPTLDEQCTIVAKLDTLSAETKKLEAIYQQKLTNLEELKKSVLQKAFAGEL